MNNNNELKKSKFKFIYTQHASIQGIKDNNE